MSNESKKRERIALVLFLGITLLAAGLSALLSGDFSVVNTLEQPPLAPPSWLFAPVWTVLYSAMAVAAFLVFRSGDIDTAGALRLYWLQLAVNVLWPIFFFRLEWRLFAFLWILLLIALVALTINRFSVHSKAAAWLLVPYLAWILFAAYLNLGYYLLNR